MYTCINDLIKQSRVNLCFDICVLNVPCCVALNLFFLNCLDFEKKLGQLNIYFVMQFIN